MSTESTLPGDLNDDGFVGGDDLDIVRSFWGQTVTAGDLLSGDPSGERYTKAGLTVLRTLLSDEYLSLAPTHEGLLLHGVYHRPNGWDSIPDGGQVPAGESVLWGDYHLMEAALLVQRLANGSDYPTFFGPIGEIR